MWVIFVLVLLFGVGGYYWGLGGLGGVIVWSKYDGLCRGCLIVLKGVLLIFWASRRCTLLGCVLL